MADAGAAYAKSFVLNRLLYETHASNLPQCADCQWRHLCAGGCPAMAIQHPAGNGGFDYRSWWCQMCQELLPRLTWSVARQLFGEYGGAPDKADTNGRMAGVRPVVRPVPAWKGGSRSCDNGPDPIGVQ